METTSKLPGSIRLFHQLRRAMSLVGLSIVALDLAIAGVWLAAPRSTLPTNAIASTASSLRDAVPSMSTHDYQSTDDYQPPDNGGPGKTGGSGTRWQ